MKRLEFGARFKLSLRHSRSNMMDMPPFVLVSLDDGMIAKQQKIEFNFHPDTNISSDARAINPVDILDDIQKSGSDISFNEQSEIFSIDQKIDKISFTDVEICKDGPSQSYYKNMHVSTGGDGSLELLPQDTTVAFYFYVTEIDDVMGGPSSNMLKIPCFIQYASARFRIYDLYKETIAGNKIVINVQSPLMETLGTITLFSWNNSNHGDSVVVLNENVQWTNVNGELKKSLETKVSGVEKIVADHRERTERWVKARFVYRSALTQRINCYYDFNATGNRLPLAFVTRQKPRMNALFFLMQFYYSVKRDLIRTNTYKGDVKALTLRAAMDIYGSNYSLVEKGAVLSQMLMIIPNGFRYITDHVAFLRTGIVKGVEQFNSSPFQCNTEDCEDGAGAGDVLFAGFKNCNPFELLKMNTNKNDEETLSRVCLLMEELRILAKTMIGLVSLDRVSMGSANNSHETFKVDKNKITAHMNFWLYRMTDFIGNTRMMCNSEGYPSDHTDVQASQFELAMQTEIKDQKVTEDALVDTICKVKLKFGKGSYSKDTARSEIQKMPVLICESTGWYSALDVKNQFQDFYRDIRMAARKQGGLKVMSVLNDMIFHDESDSSQFFLNIIYMLTGFWYEKYGLCIGGFYATDVERISKSFYVDDTDDIYGTDNDESATIVQDIKGSTGTATRLFAGQGKRKPGKLVYGCDFRRFLHKKSGIRFITEPFYTNAEKMVLFETTKTREPIPVMRAKNASLSSILSSTDRIENDSRALYKLFEMDVGRIYTVFANQNDGSNAISGGKVLIPSFDETKRDWSSTNQYERSQRYVNIARKAMERLALVSNDILTKRRAQHINSDVNVIYFTDARSLLDKRVVEAMALFLENTAAITGFQWYMELNSHYSWIVVFVFSVRKSKQ